MNKTRRRATQKHRAKEGKFELRRKAQRSTTATTPALPAAARPRRRPEPAAQA